MGGDGTRAGEGTGSGRVPPLSSALRSLPRVGAATLFPPPIFSTGTHTMVRAESTLGRRFDPLAIQCLMSFRRDPVKFEHARPVWQKGHTGRWLHDDLRQCASVDVPGTASFEAR
jgi:hypothetical protein